eukprot:749449-Hanusia_phi.AAC.1
MEDKEGEGVEEESEKGDSRLVLFFAISPPTHLHIRPSKAAVLVALQETGRSLGQGLESLRRGWGGEEEVREDEGRRNCGKEARQEGRGERGGSWRWAGTGGRRE